MIIYKIVSIVCSVCSETEIKRASIQQSNKIAKISSFFSENIRILFDNVDVRNFVIKISCCLYPISF